MADNEEIDLQQYDDVPLNYLLDKWEEGSLTNEMKAFIISELPMLSYLGEDSPGKD